MAGIGAIVALLLAAVIVLWVPELDVGRLAGGVEPFGELRGVRLNMPAAELKKVRPRVGHSPYIGYAESVGEFPLQYSFPGTPEDHEVSDRARLKEVSVELRFPDDSAGHAAWSSTVAAFARHLGRPRCWRSGVSTNATWKASASRTQVTLLADMREDRPYMKTAVTRRTILDRTLDRLWSSIPGFGMDEEVIPCS